MAAEETSIPVIDGREDAGTLMSDDEAWGFFDSATRRRLGVGGSEFLGGVRSGRYVNDDADTAVTEVFLLMDFLPPHRRSA